MVVMLVVSGCGGHYVLDKYIDQSIAVSSDNLDAIKVYVGNYRFNDKMGSILICSSFLERNKYGNVGF